MNDTWLTIVTICMDRLSQIRTTVPRNLALGYPMVFVDWSCPEHSGEWVRKNHPEVTVRFVKGEKYFSMSKSRNAGFALVKTPFTCFLDGDVFLKPEIKAWLDENLKGTEDRWGAIFGGSVVVPTKICREAGAWDELFEGWGGEDNDFWDRMDDRLIHLTVPQKFWVRMPHSDASRLSHFEIKSDVGKSVNFKYYYTIRAYYDNGFKLSYEQRRRIYERVRQSFGVRRPGEGKKYSWNKSSSEIPNPQATTSS